MNATDRSWPLLAALALLASPSGHTAGSCTRAVLQGAVQSYLTAQAHGDPKALHLGADARYVQNARALPLSHSILAQPLAIDFHRSLLDEASCQTYTEVIVARSAHPYVLGVHERVADGSIAELETIVTQKDDWLFSAANDLKYSPAENWSVVPAGERSDRAALIAAANAYFDLFSDKRVQVPWGTPCNRLEGGLRTGKDLPDDSCNVGVPSGVPMLDRRFVVDPQIGAVVGLVHFGQRGLPDAHLFRVVNGRIRYIHTITVCDRPNCGFPVPEQLLQERGEPHVVDIAFVGRSVSDLDRSVAFYEALGFRRDPAAPSDWRRDAALGRLYGAGPGLESRMATMYVHNERSGQRFVLYLREVRGIERKDLSEHTAWAAGSSHFGLVVPDAAEVWSRLGPRGLLHARSWGGKLIAAPGESRPLLAYITDPDGLDIELIDERPATPAREGRPARPALLPGVNHVGLVVLDSPKALAFYGGVLGGRLVSQEAPWLHGDFYDSAVGGHGNVLRFFNESFAEGPTPSARMNFELVEYQNRRDPAVPRRITDRGVGSVGFEVRGIDALVRRARAAGAQVVSTPAVVMLHPGTRAALLRDPDVGGFVVLFEPTEGPSQRTAKASSTLPGASLVTP